jgi:peptidyl-prolyl cis-trans isomerase SurA
MLAQTMKNLWLALSLLLVLTAFSGVTAKAEVVDRIVAIVNDEIVTLKDVQHFVEVKKKGKFASVNDYFLGMQLKDKLDALVETLLITQQAVKMKIEVGDREVEGVVENIRKQNLISDTQLKEQLKSDGISYKDFTEGIRKSLLRNRVLARVVAPELYLDDNKLKEFYQQHIDEYKESEFRLLHILVSGQRNDANVRAQQAYKLLQDGQAFESVAKEYSDDPSAATGGDIGTMKQEDLMPELKDVLSLLLPGSFSHPVHSPYGYHIVKLLDAKKSQALPFDIVKDKIRERLVQIESERRYKEYVQKLRASSYIEVKI